VSLNTDSAAPGAGISPLMRLRDVGLILVPTDFSPASKSALAVAIELARTFDAAIEVFHVDVDPSIEAPSPESIIPVRYVFESLALETRRRLEHVVAEARRAGVACTAVHELGRSARSIIEQAARSRAGLIVLGQHRRRRLRHVVLRTVAEKVVRDAPCPVLVVRPPPRQR
jgi:universal stress protein A